jgi:hypothetical protein
MQIRSIKMYKSLLINYIALLIGMFLCGGKLLYGQEPISASKPDSLNMPFYSPVDSGETSLQIHFRNYQFFALGDTLADTLVQLQIRYPHFWGDSLQWLNENLHKMAVNGTEPGFHRRNAAQTATEIFDDYFTFLADFPDYQISWYLHRTIEIIYQDSLLLTMLFNEQRYLGGAHPTDIRHFLNIDLKNQKELSLYDVIKPEKAPELAQYGEKVFRAIRELNFTGSLNAAGFWFVDDQFTLSENFSLTEAGLILYYNPYDIGPYSLGATELLLPYREINQFLQRDFRR